MLLSCTYAFQSESTVFSCLNVKELLAQNKKKKSDKTPALTENTDMGIWVIGTSNQLFIRGS